MFRATKALLLVGFVTLFAVGTALAHCQVPCGIYDDPARVQQMKEDATTIRKASQMILELSGKHDALAFNQASRWVQNKEAHASSIMKTVAEYFLAQRVKPVAEGADGYDAYLASLRDHHAVLSAAMKTKQQVSPQSVDALDAAIETLASHYR